MLISHTAVMVAPITIKRREVDNLTGYVTFEVFLVISSTQTSVGPTETFDP